MNKKMVLSFLFLILGSSAFSYAESSNHIESKTIELKNKDIFVRITKTTYSNDLGYGYKKGIWWGTDNSFPKYLITNIDVLVGGRNIFMPFSTFGDLSDPYEYYLKDLPNGFVIVIKGGDTASDYEANIIIKDSLVREKKVKLLEFPDESWEVIKYSFPQGT